MLFGALGGLAAAALYHDASPLALGAIMTAAALAATALYASWLRGKVGARGRRNRAPDIGPSGDRFGRKADRVQIGGRVRSRREAPVAGRRLGRLNWAESGLLRSPRSSPQSRRSIPLRARSSLHSPKHCAKRSTSACASAISGISGVGESLRARPRARRPLRQAGRRLVELANGNRSS
jgi:hypothetical protein